MAEYVPADDLLVKVMAVKSDEEIPTSSRLTGSPRRR
jgi:hypothetical protein